MEAEDALEGSVFTTPQMSVRLLIDELWSVYKTIQKDLIQMCKKIPLKCNKSNLSRWIYKTTYSAVGFIILFFKKIIFKYEIIVSTAGPGLLEDS